jgi:uncharacterized protein (TIGR04222 family)
MQWAWFVLAASVASIVVAVVLRLVFSGRDGVALGTAELAYLYGGRPAAVMAALGAMHARGEIAAAPPVVRRIASVATDATQLEGALWKELYAPRKPAALERRMGPRLALRQLELTLEQSGLLLPSGRWHVVQFLQAAAVILAALALVIAATWPPTSRSLTLPAVVVLGGAILVAVLGRRQPLTRAGRRKLATDRDRAFVLDTGSGVKRPLNRRGVRDSLPPASATDTSWWSEGRSRDRGDASFSGGDTGDTVGGGGGDFW